MPLQAADMVAGLVRQSLSVEKGSLDWVEGELVNSPISSHSIYLDREALEDIDKGIARTHPIHDLRNLRTTDPRILAQMIELLRRNVWEKSG